MVIVFYHILYRIVWLFPSVKRMHTRTFIAFTPHAEVGFEWLLSSTIFIRGWCDCFSL